MNYKKVLTGVLAASICFSSTGYLNTTCINADEISDQVNQADNKEPDYTFSYKVSVTEEGMLGESISYALYSNGVLKISGTGRMNNFEESPFSAPEKITAVLFDDQENCSVENIGDNTFRNCVNLYGITIPQTVTEIGTYAFSGCKSITEITVPDSVTRVGEYAFRYCSGMKKAVLGKGLTKVGPSSAEFFMFSGCYGLEELSMPSLVTAVDYVEPEKDGTIIYDPFTYTSDIGQVNKLFSNDFFTGGPLLSDEGLNGYRIKKIIVTSGEQIFPYAFAGLDIEEIVLPDTIETISKSSFINCKFISEISLPESVTCIEESAFENCLSLEKINIGKEIKTIEMNSFYDCENVLDIYFNGTESQFNNLPCSSIIRKIGGENVNKIRFLQTDNNDTNDDPSPDNLSEKILEEGALGENIDYILYGNGDLKIKGTGRMNDFEESPFKNKDKISSVIFELSDDCAVENIGRNVFNSCNNLTKVSIPDTVKCIEKYAFINCTSLTEITVPDSVTCIGESAFENCSSMKKAVLGKGLVSIGAGSAEFNIFKGCKSLYELSLPSLISSPDSIIKNEDGKKVGVQKGGQIYKLFYSDTTFTNDLMEIGVLDGIESMEELNERLALIREKECRLRKITVTSGTEIYPYEFTGLKYVNEIKLPDTITKISECAFCYCERLKEMKLPESVTEIDGRVFYGCDTLETIYIEKNIKTFGRYAFNSCDELKDVYFSGTRDQWEELKSSESFGGYYFSGLFGVSVHFTSENNFVKTIGTDTTSPEILEQNRGSGDVDGDGITDLTDLVSLSMYLLRDYDFTTGAKVYSDITKDGEVDIADLPALKMIIMHS